MKNRLVIKVANKTKIYESSNKNRSKWVGSSKKSETGDSGIVKKDNATKMGE